MSSLASHIPEGKKALEGITVSIEVTLMTSIPDSLARTSHMAPSNHRRGENAVLLCSAGSKESDLGEQN